MKSIFCTAYAAPIGYYKAIAQSEFNLLEIHEHFIKQSIRNRCQIATANGLLILTVPLSQRRNNMEIKDVNICYKAAWQKQHLKSLITAYKSSPFFEFYIDELAAIYAQKPEQLLAWNKLIHAQIIKWLKLNKPFEYTDFYEKELVNSNDYRMENWSNLQSKAYHQVFENKLGFIDNLSIYDLLFNCGNQAQHILR